MDNIKACTNKLNIEDAIVREDSGNGVYRNVVYQCYTGEMIKRTCKNGTWSGKETCYSFGR